MCVWSDTTRNPAFTHSRSLLSRLTSSVPFQAMVKRVVAMASLEAEIACAPSTCGTAPKCSGKIGISDDGARLGHMIASVLVRARATTHTTHFLTDSHGHGLLCFCHSRLLCLDHPGHGGTWLQCRRAASIAVKKSNKGTICGGCPRGTTDRVISEGTF